MSETTVGQIVGYLELNSTQWDATADRVEGKADELGRKSPDIKITTNAAETVAKLGSVQAAQNRLADSQARLQVSEMRLTELRDKDVQAGSRLTAAENAVAKARRDVTAAEGALSSALQKTERDAAKAAESMGSLGSSFEKTDKKAKESTHGLGALATAIIALGPATVPLAVATAGLAAGLGAMGAAGVLAIIGIRSEMQKGTATGAAFSAELGTLKGDLNQLSTVAAKGVLAPFQQTVHDLQAVMPTVTRSMGDFATVTGRTASNIVTGLVAAFVALEPLMQDVATYTYDLSRRFAILMSGPGVREFGDYVRSVFPQVMAAVESIVGAAINLVAAFAPLGGGTLMAIKALSDVIGAIPVNVLSTVATIASSVFLGFKSYGLAAGLVTGLSSALVKLGISAGIAATGMAALNIAAGAIGAIIAVATFLYTQHSEAVRQDQAAVDDYTQALRQSNGVIDENVRAKAFQKLSDAGAYDAAKQLGIALNLVTDASLGNVQASRELGREMQDAAAAQSDFEQGGKATGRTAGETNAALTKLSQVVGMNTRQFQDAKNANADWAEASHQSAAAASDQDTATANLATRMGITVTALQSAQQKQTDQARAAQDATTQMQLENNAAGLLKQSLDALSGKTLDAYQAQNTFDSALANMGDHVTAQGKKIHFTTTSIQDMSSASVALRGQLLQQVTAAQQTSEAYGQLKGSGEAGRQKLIQLKQAIIDNAVAHGVDRKAVEDFINKVLQIPAKVPPTKAELDAAAKKKFLQDIADLKTALAGLKDKSVVVTTVGRFVDTSTKPGGGHSTAGGSTKNADGNIYHAFAAGGFEDHVAQIAPAGAMRLWAEPETGGEAYIPLAPSKRARSSQLLAETNRLMGDPLGVNGGLLDLSDTTIAKLAAVMSRIQLSATVTQGQLDHALGGM